MAKKAKRIKSVEAVVISQGTPDPGPWEAWAIWHPTADRPMVAHDRRTDSRMWGIARTAEEALRCCVKTHADSVPRRVVIVDPRFFRIIPILPKRKAKRGK